MTTDTDAPAAAETWADLRTEAMDCLQVNLAVVADRHHGPGTHLRLGQVPAFAPDFTRELPTVEADAPARLAEAERALGLTAAERHAAPDADGLLDLLADGAERWTVADAWHLPWVPYAGHAHMEHSFLVRGDGDGVTVVDAYHNDTPWGAARPSRLRLTAAEFAAALPQGAALAVRLAPGQLAPVEPRPPWTVDPAAARAYVRAYREHHDRAAALEQLTLETWLLARARLLHAALVRGPADQERAARWKRIAEQTYLAHRRVTLGRPAPPDLLDSLEELLLAEDAPAAAPADTAPAPPAATDDELARVRRTVDAVLGRVLDLAPAETAAGQRLADLPGFNSFRLVEVLEELERAFSVEIAGSELGPANLADADALARLFLRAQGDPGAA
jgi:hypothetical protein